MFSFFLDRLSEGFQWHLAWLPFVPRRRILVSLREAPSDSELGSASELFFFFRESWGRPKKGLASWACGRLGLEVGLACWSLAAKGNLWKPVYFGKLSSRGNPNLGTGWAWDIRGLGAPCFFEAKRECAVGRMQANYGFGFVRTLAAWGLSWEPVVGQASTSWLQGRLRPSSRFGGNEPPLGLSPPLVQKWNPGFIPLGCRDPIATGAF